MPNWCDNSLTLRNSDASKIDALEKEMSKKNDDGHFIAEPFQHLRPRPEKEQDNWYDWNINYWGTKWEASIIDWERHDDNCIWISFDSAWSPPIALYDYLTEEGWDVEAYYHEPGMAYAGMFTNETGDDYYEYDTRNKESIETMPIDLIEFAGLENAHEERIEMEKEEILLEFPRSDWFDVKINPDKNGTYRIMIKSGDYEYEQWCYWDGKQWEKDWRGNTVKPIKWCGLLENVTNEQLEEMINERLYA